MEKSDLLVHIQKLQLSLDQELDQRIKMEQQIKASKTGKLPGVNFTNILGAAFACADPKSTKIH
jgi:hypothetical protein